MLNRIWLFNKELLYYKEEILKIVAHFKATFSEMLYYGYGNINIKTESLCLNVKASTTKSSKLPTICNTKWQTTAWQTVLPTLLLIFVAPLVSFLLVPAFVFLFALPIDVLFQFGVYVQTLAFKYVPGAMKFTFLTQLWKIFEASTIFALQINRSRK